ncbi:MAG: signal peptidase II [Coriobacteriales bacterium]|jgi:signal peptidase II|nr:signal peptidase II [Coriobacteriales bacterium]
MVESAGPDKMPHVRELSRIRAVPLFVAICATLLALDRLAKLAALEHLSTRPQPFLSPLLDVVLVFNKGASFGIFTGATYFLVGVAAVSSICIFVYIAGRRHHRPLMVVALAFIAAGALGNAVDRLLWGAVVDFFHFMFIDFPVFNVADCCITCGAALLIIALVSHGLLERKASRP